MSEFDRHLWAIEHVQRRRLLTNLLNKSQFQIRDLDIDEEEEEMLLSEVKHAHLQNLDREELINWNPDDNMVERGSKFEEIRSLIELIHNNQDEIPDGWL
ncbi:transcriptional regulator [Natronococcus jeotgali]|uniref:transcriptional regulator n=1 Tax=Natronococcus jeotgali TaxID=413812 RepID=UPI001267D27B|nr:transcriptional regulator [Natronococcus jeotgali]